jgi:hypothetical protein
MELLAIQPYVPLASISEFSKPLANDKLSLTLFRHGSTTICALAPASQL